MLEFWICLLFLHGWQVFENALSSKFSRVLNLAESWICKGYFGIGLNMGQFSSLMPEHVSIYLNVPQYVWTWFNIAEYHWTFLYISKKLLWLYMVLNMLMSHHLRCSTWFWIYLKAQNVPGFWICHVPE